ncbi:MAG: 2-amino-4-hydroxy-6-hydroxymethyldihydropteridine diphosphokinase [Candidatus Cloacimonetes bacterium]|jgi:2-amino-4-hydroxy-6-hydroxymethyldihydropteridine diphosphokinase|nr:2-amino-4-hydroxy-6-hydroxymethyldihydropteridine diphosphokinase [Candidatus Cloacimonadota bacterium]MDY0299274.1 2-amino-4-hydroxy-6-hydroxymethyldihydropteridine diphosphokinase [Candidatus Cloacimonadaceae bacterium]MCB5278437.1 2-amino-4-hydroxy-6-hydroxymethyldihydropteridine diphosphokinase [Candidatus Cloacimonadota bacterium]MCK9332245.1 2-amino-4-hydroxy-6-hydroxymethyldihydropteridine diphosphokinase [Candidatus Cloacimonadota bacterium]MDD3282435.1 2-amino-4-hydroxy-6-hydroxymet
MIYHLLLGSNLDEPPRQISEASAHIAKIPSTQILRKSSLKQSKPYGKQNQPDFFNQVLETESNLEANELLHFLLEIEQRMGRIRKERWGPRNIDIDILLAENTIISNENLTIPHKDLHNRAFALALLCELVPNATHPQLKITMIELLDSLTGGNK